MRYHLNEILDIPMLQKLMENFYNFSGMATSILDADGKILLAVGWQDICTKFHRVCPQTECRCRQSDQYLKEHLHEKPYILYKCLNGLIDCAVPITVDNQHLGTFFTGQFLSEPPDEELFCCQAREFGFDEYAYIDALRRIPIITEDRVESIMAFCVQLTRILSTMGLQRLHQLEATDEIIRESEERLRLVLEGSNNGYWDWNFETGELYYSSSWHRMLGYSEGDIEPTYLAWKNLIHADDRPAVLKRMNDHIQRNTSQYEAEYRFLTKSGEWKWVQGIGKVVARDIYDHPSRMTGLTADINERKLAEQQLQEERNFNAALLDTAGDLITVCDQNGLIIRFNQVCEQITGYTFDDVKGRYIWDMVVPEDIKPTKAIFNVTDVNWSSPGLKKYFENHWLTKDGKYRLISWNITSLFDKEGSSNYFIGTGTDITRQRIIEERLRESEAELRSIFENTNGIIYAVSNDGKFTFVSPGWTETLGHDVYEIIDRPFEQFIHPDDVHICWDFVNKGFSTNMPQKSIEYRIKHKDGSWHWNTSSGTTVKDRSGNSLYFVGIAVDITEHRHATEARKEYARRFRETLENVKLVAAMLDDQNRITFCNDFLLQLLGWKREEVINQDWFDTFVPPDIRKRDRRIIKKSLERGISPNFGASELLTRSGKRRIILWNNTILLNPDGSSAGFAVLGEDITQRRAVEKRSQELMQELESTNRELKDFAYIVSHDLKAPLRGIRSLAEWIYADYQDKFDEAGQEQLTMLLNRTTRMHNLLEGILQYSRLNKTEESKDQINLNEVINEVIEILVPPDNISILIENEMPLLRLERTRIFQLFENLISNAIKYMDKPNGEIRISCQNQDDYWQFSVKDNGCGIEEKYFDKIFTIFQTLKSRDEFESTGIGLTIVKKIVGMYGGKVWVESKIGLGSTFHFTLPSPKNDMWRMTNAN
ncbi:MAG: PAS domain S-box protein [Syntrophomonas sp.]|nr:PAS domain S-box protein [Syntrophomonas sp.]